MQYKFWKDNRSDQEHYKTGDELVTLFKAWLPKQEKDWLEYYNGDRTIRHFLTSKDGISSVFEEDSYNEIYHLLKPVYIDYQYPTKRYYMQTTFTIEEIRNYLLSQDSRGDIMYNLSAENIIKANQPKEDEDGK